MPTFSTIADTDGLRKIYRSPSSVVQSKVKSGLDSASLAFIAHSPFVLVGSRDASGAQDVSPRGGPNGFVSVINDGDQSFVVLPDLNGNNLIDTYTNVVATGQAGLLFFVPGQGESLRVNGAAWVSNDSVLMQSCTPVGLATPKAALVVRPDQVFIHCAKALRRSHLWDPSTWTPASAPDAIDILSAQGLIPADQIDAVRTSLTAGYETELALDLSE